MDKKIVYFDEGGPENTLETFRLVQERLVPERSSSQDIKKLVLASTTGSTAVKARDFFSQDGIKRVNPGPIFIYIPVVTIHAYSEKNSH